MKVIAKVSPSQYICEVSHDELEKHFDKYYGKMKPLDIGEVVDLGIGYNYSARIEQACKSMTNAMRDFDSARSVMTSFAVAIAKAGQQEPIPTGANHE